MPLSVCVSYKTDKADQGIPKVEANVLATVNGIPIGKDDVRHALLRGKHGKQVTPEGQANVLETLIRQELIYQRAVELGLDKDPAYLEKKRRIEAQLNAFKRKEMSNLFFRGQIEKKAAVSEKEAKEYFEKNAPRIRMEFHFWQILSKGNEAFIKESLRQIKNGTPFEEVAAKRFAGIPKASRPPWDLGFLRWNQIPQAWQRFVYKMNKGEVSGIIKGEGKRFWILKLVGKRENQNVDFDLMKSSIVRVLKANKIKVLRKMTDRDLRQRARIVYFGNRPSP
jgi:parvulin-like peptidyl-prolyl isomerase